MTWLLIIALNSRLVMIHVTKDQCREVLRNSSEYQYVSCVSPDGKTYTKRWNTKEPIENNF